MARLSIEVDILNRIARIVVDGVATVDDLERFNAETRKKLKLFKGKPFGALVDLRNMRPGPPETVEKVKEHQAILMAAGLRRSAEVLDNPVAALQLNRVARESGLISKIQRFTEIDAALKWLLEP